MPNVMIRKDAEGQMTLYVAKRDLEENVVSMEHDDEQQWGGEVVLADGSSYYIEPIATPRLPITVRAKRLADAD